MKNVSPTSTSSGTSAASTVRERLLLAADQLFYSEGIRAVSADRLISEVGTTKATFYRHFPTKDDLVQAYLERRAARERQDMAVATGQADPRAALPAVIDALCQSSCQTGFRGCPFINAAAEYPDASHPVRELVAQHRDWWRQFFADLAERHGVSSDQAVLVAEQLLMFRDGLTVAGYLDAPASLQPVLTRTLHALLAELP